MRHSDDKSATRAVLIDYGCHSFTYRLAASLNEKGYPIRYYANGSVESPNLTSLASWERRSPTLIRTVSCSQSYGKMTLHRRFQGEVEWAKRCITALAEDRPSAVIASCVPIAAVTRIQTWCRNSGVSFIYWLQDIQGKAIHDLLGRRLGFAGRVAGALASVWEQQIMEQSNLVITIAPSYERELPGSVARNGRWRLLENWANIEEFPLIPVKNRWSLRNGLADTQNIIYAGTLGLKHDLEAFVALAEAFRNRPEVRVVVVSSGQAADLLRDRAVSRNLTNLEVLPFQSSEDVPMVLASGAVLIAPLDASAGSFCVPSKVLSYICAGRPTVISIDPESPGAAVIERSRGGIVVPPGSLAAFVDAVASLLDDESARLRCGAHARAYAERTFGLEKVLGRFIEILEAGGVHLSATRLQAATGG